MSVHLHVRSAYTLLQSTMTIPKIIASTKKHGYQSVALVDKHVMHGAMAFYHACQKAHIHPIFGMEVTTKWQEEIFGFLLLAKSDDGYRALIKLSTMLNTQGHPAFLDIDEMVAYSVDCIVLTSDDQSAFEAYMIHDDMAKIQAYLKMCQATFSDFYVTIARNDSGLLRLKNKALKKMCIAMGIPTVACSPVYFQDVEEEESYRALCAIAQGVSICDRTLNYSPNRYYRSQEEMAALYDADDCKASDTIAAKCQVTMHFPKASLPTFQNTYGVSSEVFLRTLCHKGLAKRMHNQPIPKAYLERLTYELSIIVSMHYADYFLIVWDFIRYAKTQDIYIGPGRGSAAGSLVAYCLGITHVDPLHYHLLFERFLNPERVSMPDIDTDFPDNRRDDIIHYVEQRYGNHRVSHIVTFTTLGAKQVLRDVGRAMEIRLSDIDMLCKMVPYKPKITLQYVYENVASFKQMIQSSATYQKLYTIAIHLEGLPRHASLHAGGIVLSNQPIEEVCPLMDVDEGACATQFTMEYLEELGLIKMDFLGLRNLTIIDEIVHHINASSKKQIDIMHIPLDDEQTYAMLRNVDTAGIFQLESEGMKNLIRQIKPRCFEDIVVSVALFRPGPMENIPAYLQRRQHPQKVTYLHPSLQPILENTYGIMIYQEQIMQVAQRMAGFSLGKADNLRKAISKKKSDELQKLKQDFIDGAKTLGFQNDVAQNVYDQIMKFANYGFNRSHSVAYGMVVYQMAYLKANAPLYFFTCLLNSVIGAEGKTSGYVFEAKKRHIQILSPCVNESQAMYQIEGKAIRFPLLGIKGIGSSVTQQIIDERTRMGKFSDFFDFTARMSGHKMGKKTIEILIRAGALDTFKIARRSMLASVEDALRYADLVKIEDVDQVVFDFSIVSKPSCPPLRDDEGQRSQWEKEYVGFYIAKHPIETIRESMHASLPALIQIRQQRGYVRFVCVLDRIKQHRTKKGDMMAFLSASDETGSFDLVCMPNLYRVHAPQFQVGCYFYIEGIIEKEGSCLVKKMKYIDTTKPTKT